ncbi:MAG TPA: hemagglutinin repeat-containing protein, partial [Rheinheimera sp.]|nr:hemagglutinin repeat-containing protein [Rheinheimera sp.]
GPTVSASLNSSQQQDKQTTHNNSSLNADNLNIVTTGDANIIGGNLHGATAVNMDIGGDLTLESVQDRFSGSNKGFGISGGMSLGGVFTNENGAGANSKEIKTTAVGQSDGVSGVNGGVNAQSGRYQSTETVLSSITGGTVNIDVNGNTQLTGALIAALDAEGNDTGNLNLNTGSLSFTDLNNRSYSSNQSFGVSGSVGIGGKENPGDPNQTNINSSNYSYQNESSQSLDKTLATIGQGNVTVGGNDASPEGLNRDVDNINKEIYAVDRQQGNIDLTVDHRLLTEEGRKQIAEDAKRTEILGSAIVDIAENSVSLTGSGEGEDSLRDHIGNTQDYFTATKNFTQNTANTEHVATLENPNATPEQKQAAYTALVNEIATYLGVDPTEAKVLMQNDPQFAGAFSRDTDTVYVNDLAHNNATEAVNTVGHETQHYLDNQQNPNAERTEQYKDNRENYADIMGDATADYLGFNFAQNGSSLAGGNNHSLGSNADEAMRNLGLVTGNNTAYGAERPEALDNRYLNPEERKLAEQLAKDSGGRFTTQEMLDALRHARPSESTDYPQGMNENVLDTALATDETLKYLDGSEGRLIVTQDENGDARYIVQDMSNIPLNEDAKEYIKQQDLGYSFIEQVERTESLPVFRDMLTGKPLDESGRYMMGYDVDGNVYNVPHYSCATADCLSQKLNIDWN